MKTLRPFLLLLTLLILVVQSKAQVNSLKVAITKVTESYTGIKNALAAEDGDARPENEWRDDQFPQLRSGG